MAIKNQNEENKNVQNMKNEDLIVEQKEPIWRMVVKYSLVGLGAIASCAVGFFIGRGSSDDDNDDKKTESTDE